ncbi:MAG TPA: D-alanyl-D-alanine carboxypeptidase family protein [Thermodesulfovibrionales bacterium]|nr:D-alanyl-D-alanine carboxypeptidase family protein [Thermodesulfovibrionales bacterium]
MKQSPAISHRPSAGTYCIVLLLCVLCTGLRASSASAEEVRARAAIVMEEATGRVLYGKNPNLRLPPASTTKLMTAMVVLDRLDVDSVVTISKRATEVSPIKAKFRAGETVTVKTLLYAALLKSANDAAYALAEAVAGSEEKFAVLMNQKVLALGMSDTVFATATGLPGGTQYTTVYDLSRIMRNALRYPLLREIISTRASNITTEEGRTIFVKNINKLLWRDESMLGGKTGYTRAAKHCFVCAGTQDNETVIVAVLGAPSREVLWKESEALLAKGFAVKSSQEEPVIYFTRSDYRTSVKQVSYAGGTQESGDVSYKKPPAKGAKKAGKNKSKGHSGKKKKRVKSNDIALKGPDGTKG